MPDPGQDGENGESRDEPAADPGFDDAVERAFTCSLCGFATTYEVGPLRAEVQSVCVNCGDWTVQTAPVADLVAAARDVAAELAGPILTERQALAYLLRDVVGVERETAAEAMDSSPSNVDNLRRRGAAKVAAAGELVAALDALRDPGGGERDGDADGGNEAEVDEGNEADADEEDGANVDERDGPDADDGNEADDGVEDGIADRTDGGE